MRLESFFSLFRYKSFLSIRMHSFIYIDRSSSLTRNRSFSFISWYRFFFVFFFDIAPSTTQASSYKDVSKGLSSSKDVSKTFLRELYCVSLPKKIDYFCNWIIQSFDYSFYIAISFFLSSRANENGLKWIEIFFYCVL